MKKQEKKEYEVPALTVVQFKVERGYATSLFGTDNNLGARNGDNGNDAYMGDAMAKNTEGGSSSWF